MLDLPVQENPVQVKCLCGRIKNPRKAGNLGRYLAGRVTVPMRCKRAQTGAFLAAIGAVCGDAVE